MHAILDKIWYQNHPLRFLLWPFSFVYRAFSAIHRYITKKRQEQFNVPVIVVGNLTVGGVGKTPLVIAIAQALHERGLKVGIVSRGYKARCRAFPCEVTAHSSVVLVGDEPLLIAQRTSCPVVIDPKRPRAVRYLIEQYDVDIVLSDDGLQHYALGRQLEIVVIDGKRGLGNGLCLPAGPLREGKGRLKTADMIVVNQGRYASAYSMRLKPGLMTNLYTGERFESLPFDKPVAAVAGIGHPQRFFATLLGLGIRHTPYIYPDHHHYKPEELRFDEKIVVMTEKDAVKCLSFASDKHYYLPIDAVLDAAFWQDFWAHVQPLLTR